MAVTKGEFVPLYKGGVSFDPSGPSLSDKVWLDVTTNTLYVYDDSRGKWLAANRDYIEFVREGVSDGMYMPIIGDLDSEVDCFKPAFNSTITAIQCRSRGGSADKSFELQINGVSIFQFVYTGTDREYVNESCNVDINTTDEIRLYVTEYGGPTHAPWCRIEVARRYDI